MQQQKQKEGARRLDKYQHRSKEDDLVQSSDILFSDDQKEEQIVHAQDGMD